MEKQFIFCLLSYFFIPDGKERGERTLPEEFRGDAVQPHPGCQHKVQAPAGTVPAGHVSAVRFTEAVLPGQLALLPGHVPVASQEPGPQDVQSSAGYV